ncbi:uncharacterized protein ACRADG_002420 [Cochliomyia hominivorax]
MALESDLQAATTAAALNLSLGSSGSLFTNPSLSASATGGSSGGINRIEHDTTDTSNSGNTFNNNIIMHASKNNNSNNNSNSNNNNNNNNSNINININNRFSPRQSPKQDIEVIEIFKSEIDKITAAAQQVSVVHISSKESSRKAASRHSSDGANNGVSTTHTQYMDKHLSELEQENMTETTCDIEAYMANLKETSIETSDLNMDGGDQQQNDSSLSPEPQTVVENTQQTVIADIESPPRPSIESDSAGTTTGTSEKSEDESEDGAAASVASSVAHVIIDKKVDKVFKSKSSDKISKTSKPISSGSNGSSSTSSVSSKAKPIKSPRQSIYVSPDRSKSQGSSPVRIIKIKSPRTSLSDQGKRLSVSSSRDSSHDRLSTGRRTPSPRRSSDGTGILKRSASPSGGILKRPPSPSKAKSPDRSCLKKLTPSHDCSLESLSPHLSPRNSIEYLSPDRSTSCKMCQHHSPRNSFDSRSSEPNLDLPRSVLKSPRGSFESRSPDRNLVGARKRSASAHAHIDNGEGVVKGKEAYYQYYPIYDNRTCSDHYVSVRRDSVTRPEMSSSRRISKSLERSLSRDSTTSSSYRYGVSPEHIYTINTSDSSGPIRSQSAENAFASYRQEAAAAAAAASAQSAEQYYYQQYGPQTNIPTTSYNIYHEPQCPHDRPYQLSSSAPEHTTCMDCLYQKKPS